jgi:hypothetical protein
VPGLQWQLHMRSKLATYDVKHILHVSAAEAMQCPCRNQHAGHDGFLLAFPLYRFLPAWAHFEFGLLVSVPGRVLGGQCLFDVDVALPAAVLCWCSSCCRGT